MQIKSKAHSRTVIIQKRLVDLLKAEKDHEQSKGARSTSALQLLKWPLISTKYKGYEKFDSDFVHKIFLIPPFISFMPENPCRICELLNQIADY